jgi:hypothetical protein
MPWSQLNNPKHWRERAKEAQALAQHMTDLEAKQNDAQYFC